MLHILFVCTGNTCRSPIAEGILHQWIQKDQLPVQVQSAGIAAIDGVLIARHAEKALKQRGMKAVSSSQPVQQSLVEWADLILTMTTYHKKVLLEQFPEAMDKVYSLKEYVIDDPEIKEIFSRLDALYSEVELKQSLFLSRHREEIEALEQQYRHVQGELEEIEERLGVWRNKLAEVIQQERAEIERLEGKLPNFDVHDPYGGSEEIYEHCAKELEFELKKLLDKIKSEVNS
jgi:protein-tyrosine-phosphatase